MPAVPVAAELLKVGRPLPVQLVDPRGRLLLARGSVIVDETHLMRVMQRQPHLEERDLEVLRRAWVVTLDAMVRGERTLGAISQVGPQSAAVIEEASQAASRLREAARREVEVDLVGRCADLQRRLGNTLREPQSAVFLARLEQDSTALECMARESPDELLLVLMLQANRDCRDYGVHHALVVAAVCLLATLEDPARWPANERRLLVQAALTMNLSILSLQDQLARHDGPLAPRHVEALAGHGLRSAQVLREAGVDDGQWLQAVALHHDVATLAPRPADSAGRLAHLIHRADVLCARMSPRKERPPLRATQAAQAALLDEQGRIDEAGSLLIKALGVYPPGTLVALRNGEAGIVRRRGGKPAEPLVASLVGASGLPLAAPVMRDASLDTTRVVRALVPQEVNVQPQLPVLLALD